MIDDDALDNRHEDDEADEDHSWRLYCTPADLLKGIAPFRKASPSELLNALTEGNIRGLVSLPTPFECDLCPPAHFWGRIEQANFLSQLDPTHTVPAFSVAPSLVLEMVTGIVDNMPTDIVSREYWIGEDCSFAKAALIYDSEIGNAILTPEITSDVAVETIRNFLKNDLWQNIKSYTEHTYNLIIPYDDAKAEFPAPAIELPARKGRPTHDWTVTWEAMIVLMASGELKLDDSNKTITTALQKLAKFDRKHEDTLRKRLGSLRTRAMARKAMGEKGGNSD
jgi:hypothetical protein